MGKRVTLTEQESSQVDDILRATTAVPPVVAPAAVAIPPVVEPQIGPGTETGVTEALRYGAQSGATLGLASRVAGLGAKAGELYLRARGKPALPGAYSLGRQEYEAREEEIRAAQPVAFGAAELAGTVLPAVALSPVSRALAPAAVKAGPVARFAARAAPMAAAGGIAGAATAPEGAGVGEISQRAGTGVLVGTALSAGGELAGKATLGVARAVSGGIKRRILNEVAEGLGQTTATGRKRLEKAAEPILKEVVSGPDAIKVRGAYLGGAERGRRDLEPIIRKVADKNDRAYEKFSKIGKDNVSVDEYQDLLAIKALDARDAGQSRLADAVDAFSAKVGEQAELTGGMKLRQLRGLTTEAQGIASGVLGSLNEQANAKVARQASAVVTEAMDDVLTSMSKGSRTLKSSAQTIRGNNERLNALLTIDDSLRLRAYKEATGRGILTRVAERAAAPSAIGAALGAAQSEEKFTGALRGAAIGAGIGYGLPAAARAAERGLTTAAIKAAQGRPILPGTAARRLSEAIGRTAIIEGMREQR